MQDQRNRIVNCFCFLRRCYWTDNVYPSLSARLESKSVLDQNKYLVIERKKRAKTGRMKSVLYLCVNNKNTEPAPCR